MGVSIKDVAQLAHVSTSTVSHVINKSRKVSPETEQKVLVAIKKLNYELNPIASNLRSGNSKMIGYVVANLSNFFLDIGLVIEDIVKERGYQLIYLNSNETKEREQQHIKRLIMQSIDGLIIAPVESDCSYMNQMIGERCPSVFFDRPPIGFNRDYVLSTNSEGAFQGTELLLKRGHTRIGFIGSHRDRTMIERFEGFRSAVTQNGLAFNDRLVEFGDHHSSPLSALKHGECYHATKRFIEEEHVTAIFCGNDIASIGVVNYLKENDFSIPEDFDVVSFDDSFWLSLAYRSISAVDQDWELIGKTVAHTLLKRISSTSDEYSEVRIPTKLITR